MNYQDYIDLGFKRIDINDSVEFRRHGYSGYLLVKKINKRMRIEVHFTELDNPILYINKKDSETTYSIDLLPGMVEGIFSKS